MKGFYSVLIGVIVLLVLSTALFTVTSFNKSQALVPQKESFGYTIKQWQNARRMLDKSTSDAIIDSAFAAKCLTIHAAFNDSNIISYNLNTISEMNSNCKIKNLNSGNIVMQKIVDKEPHSVGERSVFDINVYFDLKCQHHLEIGIDLNSLVSYDKNVLLQKRIDANFNTSANDCNLFVLDLDSNLMDVNYFVSWP